MAKDMRVITCTLKMITAAERIGRYGKDIAEMVKSLQDQPGFYAIASSATYGRPGPWNDR